MGTTGRYAEYLATATEAVRRGASVLEEHAGTDYEVRHKTPTDLVSAVDLAAEERIVEHVQERHPDHAVLAEESGETGDAGPRWLVDPLDGTANFVNGIPHYAVTVALEVGGEVVVGVTYCPPADDHYTAVRGEGAFLNGEPIVVSGKTPFPESLTLVGSSPPAVDDERFVGLVRRLAGAEGCQGVRRLGSSATDLGWVARGRVDAYVDDYTSPWDVAAGSLLVEAAGGRVTDLRGGDLDLAAGERRVGILATNGRVHDDLLAAYEAADPGGGAK